MPPTLRVLVATLAAASLPACSQPKGYDQLNLRVEEVGEAQLDTIAKPPTRIGEITTWRTSFPGQVFAAVKTEAACPREIHTFAGVEFKKDRIELCFSAPPRDEPVTGFACSPEVYVKYEIMGVPTDVEPTFSFVGECAGIKAARPSTP